jgi:hypothetical protein
MDIEQDECSEYRNGLAKEKARIRQFPEEKSRASIIGLPCLSPHV